MKRMEKVKLQLGKRSGGINSIEITIYKLSVSI